MGCDIHCYAEKKIMGKWVEVDFYKRNQHRNTNEVWHSSTCYDGRNYTLFGYLNSVRGSGCPFEINNGIPDDVSDAVKNEYSSWGGDAHSPAHRYLYELLDQSYDGCGYRDELWDWTISELKALAKDKPDEVRIVFWFDN